MSTNGKTKTKATTPFMETGGGTDCTAIKARVDSIDWTKIRTDLDTQGWAVVPKLLTQAEADSIAGLYPQEEGVRSHVVMARHGFGRGEYKYFSYPLPPLIGVGSSTPTTGAGVNYERSAR
jgi:hypothetical protein